MNAPTAAACASPLGWIVFLAAGALITGLYLFVPPFAGSGPVMNLLGLAPVLAIAAGVRLYRPQRGSPGLSSPLASSCSGSVTSTRTATRSCFTATCRSHRSATPRIWRSTRP